MLMGVISFYDVAKAVVDAQDFENRMLKAYIRDWPVEEPGGEQAGAVELSGVLESRFADHGPGAVFRLSAKPMSGSTLGTLFRVTNFGESHGPAIGCVIDGCPPGMALAEADIQPELDRRRPGTSRHVTQRNEPDAVRDPLRRLRGPDDRHADLPADPQHRPAQQGLRQHPRHLPPRPRRLHLLAQVRPARPARRRPRVGAADGADGRRRRGGAQVAARAARHRRFAAA